VLSKYHFDRVEECRREATKPSLSRAKPPPKEREKHKKKRARREGGLESQPPPPFLKSEEKNTAFNIFLCCYFLKEAGNSSWPAQKLLQEDRSMAAGGAVAQGITTIALGED
jgi:hypothetical protein